jgi:hypothetical protein
VLVVGLVGCAVAGCSSPPPARETTSTTKTSSGLQYTPPAEGTASLLESLTAQRVPDGRVAIRGKLLLPETTRIWVELFPIKAVVQDEPLGHAELYLDPGGTFEAGPFRVSGSGDFRVQVTSYFNKAWQPTDVLRAVGTKGVKLPKSALKLDNPGTPDVGGHLEYSKTVTIGS